jgi:streptothricin acetyltransferase
MLISPPFLKEPLSMFTIQPLTHIDQPLLQRLITGYTTDVVYRAIKTESDAAITIDLRLTPQPYIKRYSDLLDAETLQRYTGIVQTGHSFAAYDDGQCVALAVCEAQAWNASLAIWEFHVEHTHQCKGIGRRLMEAVADHARMQNLRALVCETQSTNVPAIRFYRALGFTLDGIDLSFYTNQDYPDGEIAVFMKRHL